MPYWNIARPMKTALVLSAGGMFGAWQAGAWKALAARFDPHIVVGASAGALNGWAIAGGVPPEELAGQWLAPAAAALAAFHPTWRSVFDSRALHRRIEALWSSYRPQRGIGVVAVELPRLRPRLFRDGEIGPRHLAASCAVLFAYEQIRIGGKFYTDGGLLGALPLWAAAEMGAGRIIALNAFPRNPSRLVRGAVSGLRAFAPPPLALPSSTEVFMLAPSEPLGPLRDAMFWRREAIERWIALGERDGGRLGSRL